MQHIPEIYNDPIISRKRKGSAIDPFKEITESIMIEKYYALLTEIPNRRNRVRVKHKGRTLYEVRDQVLNEDTFRVDYVNGIVYFHGRWKGETLDFEYVGEGVFLFPDSRIYLTEDPEFANARDKFRDIDRGLLEQKNRVDTLIIETPQPSEVVDIRIDRNGKVFPVARDRINSEQKKIEDAYIDANDKRYPSLKARIDSLQLATDEKVDEIEEVHTNLWARLNLVPGQITAEVGKLSEKVDGDLALLKAQIDLVPDKITIAVEELHETIDGELDSARSSIKILSDEIELKVDVDGVVNSINISEEDIAIDGSKIKITGETHIDDAVIESANIRDLDADKINVGTLEGHTLKGAHIIGGEIEQVSNNRRLEMNNGTIDSFWNDKLAMSFGQFSLDFYNANETLLGQVIPLVNENDERYEGLGIIVENDFINIGMRQGGYIRPVFRSSVYDNVTTVSGPYRNANEGASLRFYGNRRLVSEDRFSDSDQPSIHLDQSDTTNNLTMYFGGFSRRNDATFQVRHRNSGSTSVNRIEANANGVYLGGLVTGSSSVTEAILGPNGNAYYENGTGTNNLREARALRANGIRAYGTGQINLYLGTQEGGEVRITSESGRNDGGNIIYRDIRAAEFHTNSSRKYKTNIVPVDNVGLNTIRGLSVVNYQMIEDVKNGIKDVKIGFIAEDSPSIANKDNTAISFGKLTTYNTKAIQEIDQEIIRLKMEVEVWKEKVKELKDELKESL